MDETLKSVREARLLLDKIENDLMSITCTPTDPVDSVDPDCAGRLDCSRADWQAFYPGTGPNNVGAELPTVGGVVTQDTCQSARMHVCVTLEDCQGADQSGVDRLDSANFMRVDLGEENFDPDRTAADPNPARNWYIVDSPSTGGTATMSIGPTVDGGDVCSFVIEVLPCETDEELQKELEIPSTNIAEGSFNDADWEAMTDGTHVFSTSDNRVSVVTSGGQQWLQVLHPANTVSGVVMGGALPDMRNYAVEFTAEFDQGFDYGGSSLDFESGKFGFGLAGGQSSNGQIVSGGNSDTTGYSVRFVWRGATAKIYSYHANREGMPSNGTVFGEEFPGPSLPRTENGAPIIAGTPQRYRMEISLNDPGVANGSIRAFQNGVQFVNEAEILFMDGVPEVDRCFFASFHGGGSTQWAPGSDERIRYRDIVYYGSN